MNFFKNIGSYCLDEVIKSGTVKSLELSTFSPITAPMPAKKFVVFKNCNDSEPIATLGNDRYTVEELRKSLGEDVEIRRIDIPGDSSISMYGKDGLYYHRREGSYCYDEIIKSENIDSIELNTFSYDQGVSDWAEKCYTVSSTDTKENNNEAYKCYNEATWVKNNRHVHPEWYPTLNADSTFEDVQFMLFKRSACSYFPCNHAPPAPLPKKIPTTTPTKGKLVFEDNFNSFDTSIWTANTEIHVNGEIQDYSSDKRYAYTQNGVLNLLAIKNEQENKWYSARYNTRGVRQFQYGYIETRVRMPAQPGSFPAVWMLPDSIDKPTPWPLCGELDIFEYQSIWDEIPSTLHFHERHGGESMTFKGPFKDASDWHVYGVDWREDRIAFYHDNKRVGVYRKPPNPTQENWPYDQEFFLIINNAVHPHWGSQPDEGVKNLNFEIDYIK
eukprot:Pgem_evm1s17207